MPCSARFAANLLPGKSGIIAALMYVIAAVVSSISKVKKKNSWIICVCAPKRAYIDL